MAPITINRAPFNALFDDSGQNLDGSEWDKAAISLVLLDQIDGALAKVPVDAGTGKIPDAALSANVALKNVQNIFAAPAGSLNQFTNGLNAGGSSQFSGTLVQFTAPVYVDNGLTIRNVIMNLASGGCIFPAAQIAQSDPNTLDDYEEGGWTPTDVSGAGLVFAVVPGRYIKIGRIVTVTAGVTWPTTSNGAQAWIGGLPFSLAAGQNTDSGSAGFNSSGLTPYLIGVSSGVSFQLCNQNGAGIPNSSFTAKTLYFTLTYQASS